MDPTLIAGLGGLVGGMFGGPEEPELPPQYGQGLDIMGNMIQRLRRRLRAPLASSLGVKQQLATINNLTGQQYGQAKNATLAQYGPGQMDLARQGMQNLDSSRLATTAGLQGQVIQNAASQRAALPMQIAGLAGQMSGIASQGARMPQGGSNLGGALGGLAQTYAYSQGLKQLAPSGPRLAPIGGGMPDQGISDDWRRRMNTVQDYD